MLDLNQRVTRGDSLWIAVLLFDAIASTLEMRLTPDPERVKWDRVVLFSGVSMLQLDRYHDTSSRSLGDFNGFEIAPAVDETADFKTDTGDALLSFRASLPPSVRFDPPPAR